MRHRHQAGRRRDRGRQAHQHREPVARGGHLQPLVADQDHVPLGHDPEPREPQQAAGARGGQRLERLRERRVEPGAGAGSRKTRNANAGQTRSIGPPAQPGQAPARPAPAGASPTPTSSSPARGSRPGPPGPPPPGASPAVPGRRGSRPAPASASRGSPGRSAGPGSRACSPARGPGPVERDQVRPVGPAQARGTATGTPICGQVTAVDGRSGRGLGPDGAFSACVCVHGRGRRSPRERDGDRGSPGASEPGLPPRGLRPRGLRRGDASGRRSDVGLGRPSPGVHGGDVRPAQAAGPPADRSDRPG